MAGLQGKPIKRPLVQTRMTPRIMTTLLPTIGAEEPAIFHFAALLKLLRRYPQRPHHFIPGVAEIERSRSSLNPSDREFVTNALTSTIEREVAMPSSKHLVLTEARLFREMSEVISLREKVAQAELDAGRFGIDQDQVYVEKRDGKGMRWDIEHSGRR
jgi:hypothetical protein